MNNNQINLELSSTELLELTDSLKSFSTKLQQAMEKNELLFSKFSGRPRLGEKSEVFVERALEHALNHPELVPGFANQEEARIDFKTFKDLKILEDSLEILLRDISHIRLCTGAEALDFANDMYKYVQLQTKNNNAAARMVFEDLKSRYQKRNRKTQSQKEPQA